MKELTWPLASILSLVVLFARAQLCFLGSKKAETDLHLEPIPVDTCFHAMVSLEALRYVP